MLPVNLIPAHRQLRRKKALRISCWSMICALYGVLVMVVCVASLARHQVSNLEDLEAQIQTVNNEIDITKRNIAQLSQEVAEAEKALQASEAVGPQPDWSILLTALASEMGRNIVMGSCELSPVTPEEPTQAEPRDPQRVEAFSLNLGGFGRTQSDVSDFVLRLEEMTLLDTVSLVSSRREPFLADYAVAFQIRCSIAGTGRTE